MSEIRNHRKIWWIAGALLVLTVAAGCGVKGPPVPPRAALLPVVSGLEASLAGDNMVHLRWRLPAEQIKPSGVVGEFWVYRARIEKSSQDCLDCPVLFKRIARVGSDRSEKGADQTLAFSFRETVVSGFKYLYKVKPVTPGGTPGDDSNTVTIDY